MKIVTNIDDDRGEESSLHHKASNQGRRCCRTSLQCPNLSNPVDCVGGNALADLNQPAFWRQQL